MPGENQGLFDFFKLRTPTNINDMYAPQQQLPFAGAHLDPTAPPAAEMKLSDHSLGGLVSDYYKEALPQGTPFAGASLTPPEQRDVMKPPTMSTLGAPTTEAQDGKPPVPGLFEDLTIKDYAALLSAAGTLGSMLVPKPKRVRTGSATHGPGGNFFLRRSV